MIASAWSGKVREALLKEGDVHTLGEVIDTFTSRRFSTRPLLLHLPSGAGVLQRVEIKALRTATCDHPRWVRNKICMEKKL